MTQPAELVKAEKQVMSAKIQETKSTHDNMDGLLTELLKYMATTVKPAWEGMSGDSFQDELTKYTTAKNQLVDALADLVTVLNEVLNNLDTTDVKMQKVMQSQHGPGEVYAGLHW